MKKSSDISAVLKLTLLFGLIVCLLPQTGAAQAGEQFNSPLYAPKTYDPNQSGSISSGLPAQLNSVGIDQKLGSQLPLDAEFKDENGNAVKLGEYFNRKKPVVLALVYYDCPMLCNEVLNGLTGSLKGVSFNAGQEFDVVVISFDERGNEKPDAAKLKKENYMNRYGRPGTENGWHFLTGKQSEIDKVTQAVGFRYVFDEKNNQFAHAGGVEIATPEGKISRYFYGIDYSPKDLKFGLMDSAQEKIGNPVEKLLLYCFHYDPASGKYGFAVIKALKIASIATLVAIAAMMLYFRRYNKNKAANLK